jgi:hypothetical protein
MIAHRSSAVKMALLTVALVVALSSDAAATHSNGAGPKMDFVFGTGMFRGLAFDGELHVNAKSESGGGNPQGEFFVRFAVSPILELDFRGSVTCLAVANHTAIVGGEISVSRVPLVPASTGVLIQIVDGGEPGAGRDAVSFLPTLFPPTTCELPDDFPAVVTIDRGNFVVHDAECIDPACID